MSFISAILDQGLHGDSLESVLKTKQYYITLGSEHTGCGLVWSVVMQ